MQVNFVEFLPRSTIEKKTFPLSSLVETCFFARLALILSQNNKKEYHYGIKQ